MASIGPLSPGTMADDSAVGTVSWTNPNNAKVSDNNYVTFEGYLAETSHYLKATNFGFSIPTGVTINGILVEIERKSYFQSFFIDSTVKIVKSDGSIGTTNKADTANLWPTTDTYKSYGADNDLWGETWTEADIENINFGVVLSARYNNYEEYSTCGVDHIRITVYYTEATTKSPFPTFFRI